MGGAFVTSDDEPDRAVQEVSAPTGCTGSGTEVGAPSTALVAGNPVTGCPISGDVEVSHGSSSGDHTGFFAESYKSPTHVTGTTHLNKTHLHRRVGTFIGSWRLPSHLVSTWVIILGSWEQENPNNSTDP